VPLLRIPDAARNPLSLIGMAIATAMAIVFLALVALELAGYLTNPYIGLLIFVAVPVLFVAGLLLVPIGAWRTARRRRRFPGAEPTWPVIDLRQPSQRRVLAAVFVLTIVNLVILSVGAYGGVHYMESAEFCGQVCHVTMEPQAAAHRAWPHASVSCTQCHVGPGAGAFVEGKLAGTRQLYHVLTNQVPRPVPPPADLLQSSAVTCEGCHSPEHVAGDVLRQIHDYRDDEANTGTVTTLRLHVGDRARGIHRHNGLTIEYVASDPSRSTIPFVRVLGPGDRVREYVMEGVTREDASRGVARRMGCTDCHNRPAHTFDFTPQRAVDRAIAAGLVPSGLPFVRREAVAAVTAPAAGRQAGSDAIARRLETFYAAREAVDREQVRRAIAGVQQVWLRNVFPEMKVTWGTYPNHLGHVDTPGCFRCHDDSHKTADGTSITQECELCHTLE
jgi:hypothetical protein